MNAIDGSVTYVATFTAEVEIIDYPDEDDPDYTFDENDAETHIEGELPGGVRLVSVDTLEQKS